MVCIHLLGKIVQRHHDTVGTIDVTLFAMRKNAADKTVIVIVASFTHLCHDGQHLLGVEIAMHFYSVAKKSEGVGEISLVDGGPLTFRLPCKLLVVDDQCNSMREIFHAIFVDSCSFVSSLRIHQFWKAETDWLKVQTIQVEGVKVLNLYLATINVSSLPVQNIELCSENECLCYICKAVL